MSDAMASLAQHLDSLDERDIAEHPDALEDVHRRLVAELDALAGGPRTPTRS